MPWRSIAEMVPEKYSRAAQAQAVGGEVAEGPHAVRLLEVEHRRLDGLGELLDADDVARGLEHRPVVHGDAQVVPGLVPLHELRLVVVGLPLVGLLLPVLDVPEVEDGRVEDLPGLLLDAGALLDLELLEVLREVVGEVLHQLRHDELRLGPEAGGGVGLEEGVEGLLRLVELGPDLLGGGLVAGGGQQGGPAQELAAGVVGVLPLRHPVDLGLGEVVVAAVRQGQGELHVVVPREGGAGQEEDGEERHGPAGCRHSVPRVAGSGGGSRTGSLAPRAAARRRAGNGKGQF
jgi:hypothetical protein